VSRAWFGIILVPLSPQYLHYFYMLWYNCMTFIFIFILFIFLVAMCIVYFSYMLSIVGLSSYLCLSSCSIHPNVHRVGGTNHVIVVPICYLPMNTLYISAHVVDHGCDTPIESFVVHFPNIGHRSRARL
jgi:membrane glycosyltransferase